MERLPKAANSPKARELAALRRRLEVDPGNPALALDLVGRYLEDLAAEGDPRYAGYAQAVLAPWWSSVDPPPQIRVARAVVLQFGHQFEPALRDLEAAVRDDPGNAQAWAWIAAISMVQAQYGRAREACERAGTVTSRLNAVACLASVDSATGKARHAAQALERALQAPPDAPAEQRLWALTRLAETRERLADFGGAEAAFKQALALDITDGYLLAAYADFLLDQGRAAEVLELLRDRQRSDVLLLRLALAAKATNHPSARTWITDLGARFDAARRRGDTLHQKEEARYALALLGDPARALPLAEANFRIQREAADARILLEAALAARQPASAAPVLAWMRESGIESAPLHTLATRLGTLR